MNSLSSEDAGSASRRRSWSPLVLMLLAAPALFVAACTSPSATERRGAETSSRQQASTASTASSASTSSLSSSAPIDPSRYAKPIRVACVGDSITFGFRTKYPALEAYPAQLQRMLDRDSWWVRNFGVSGATLLNRGDRPYQKQTAFREALAFNPDVVVIMLGTNDTKPQNWVHQSEFEADYKSLVAQFAALPAHPRIFLCRPVLVARGGAWGINEPNILLELPRVDALAHELGAGEIDLHQVLQGHEDLLPDNVHPIADGEHLMALAVYEALIGSPFTGTMDPVLHTWWEGYHRTEFVCDGRVGFVVEPKTPAPQRPWIWRPEFFGVEPQTELALLARGWSAAYIDVTNLYGAPTALDAMDQFYERVRHDFRLAPKVVLAGFSRGGLFAFNWAARHPERVACIYGDAPVLDFKSWPGGRGKGPGSAADWQRLLGAYAFTEAQALAYPSNPIDNLAPLAAAHIPILLVAGDADQTVPFEENAQLAKARYEALGGKIELIVKHGGDHHPHSLKDPTPIVNFIEANAK